jgi:hypothetical protein
MAEMLAVTRKVAVSVRLDSVTIEVDCGDAYEAQVLYDDLVERLQSGDSVTLSLIRKAAPPPARREP